MEFSGKLYFNCSVPTALQLALEHTFDIKCCSDIIELYAYNPDGIDCIDELPLILDELEPYLSRGDILASSDDGTAFRYIFEDGSWSQYLRTGR